MFYRLPFSQVCIFSFVFCSCFFCAAVLPLYLSTHHRRLFCSFEKPLAAVWVLFIVVFLRLRFVFLFASVVGGPKKKRASTNEAFDSLTFYCVSSSSLSFCWRRFVFRCFSCCSFQFLFLFVYFATKLHCLPLRPQLLSSSFSNALLLCTITESFPRYFPSLPSCMRL